MRGQKVIFMNEYIVVGAGISGSIIARKLAEEKGKKVTVLEKRPHVAGNLFDEYVDGVLIQKYGPHFLLTNEWWIVEYLRKFTDFYEYPARAVSYVDGKYIDRPYNFRSLQQILGAENSHSLLIKLRKEFCGKRRISLFDLLSNEDSEIMAFGQLMYDEIYSTYVAKQWGLKVEEIDPLIINRAQFVLGYDTQLCELDYQYLPSNGYSQMIRNMLNHENITVELEVDAIEDISFDNINKKVKYRGCDVTALVFTGQIDSLFEQCYGILPYRSRVFKLNKYKEPQLPCGVVTYPKNFDYIRQTEYSQFNPKQSDITVLQSEYSVPLNLNGTVGNEPYYPIINTENNDIYRKYKAKSEEYSNLFLCGRLAQFKYLDIDTAIMSAVDVYNKIKGE